MKFSAEQEEFSSAMSMAGRVASQGRDNPALGGILVELAEGKLTFSATDGNQSIRIPVHLAGAPDGDGRVLLPGKVLPNIATALRPGTVEVAYRPEERDVEIKSGTSVFHVKALVDGDFPPLPGIGEDPISLDREALMESIGLVAGAASTGDMRPVLTAIQVTIGPDRLTMAATDSYRLAVKETPISSGPPDEIQLNVPAEAMKELERIMGVSETEKVRMSTGERNAIFDVDGTVLSTNTVEGQFPKYQQLFPESWEHDVRLPRDELLESVRRVGKMLDKGRPIRITLSPGELRLSAEAQEVGDASETLPAAFDGEETSIGFNHEYFRNGIEAVKGEELLLRVISPLRPGLIQPVEGEDFRYLVMPLRLND